MRNNVSDFICYTVCQLFYLLLLIPIINDNTNYKYPLKIWLIIFLVLSYIFYILRIIRWFVTDTFAKQIVTLSNILLTIFYILWLVVGYVWQKDDTKGQLKLIINTICNVAIILAIITMVTLIMISIYLVIYEHENDNNMTEKQKLLNIEKIEQFTNLHVYSDFFKSDYDKFDKNECIICIDNYLNDDKIRLLKCGHHFHDICIKKWLIINTTCPQCRNPIDNNII